MRGWQAIKPHYITTVTITVAIGRKGYMSCWQGKHRQLKDIPGPEARAALLHPRGSVFMECRNAL